MNWLVILAVIWLAGGAVAALFVAAALWRDPPRMWIMVPVWIITPLYFGPPGWWIYRWLKQPGRFAEQCFTGTLHCGAGCTLGDVLAEWVLVGVGAEAFGARLGADFCAAFLFGILFQYFSIAPMRHLRLWEGIRAALLADAASLIAFEIGLFGWMALMRYVLFSPPLEPDRVVYWFMMQVGMVVGFCTSYPVNWRLLRAGVKEAM